MNQVFAGLFEATSIMHASANWAAVEADLTTVLGEPTFSDGEAWAAWPTLKLSDETDGPSWCVLAKTRDLGAVTNAARAAGWSVGARRSGGHETRVLLTAPSGFAVIAYAPTG